jgi:hypothetical protein
MRLDQHIPMCSRSSLPAWFVFLRLSWVGVKVIAFSISWRSGLLVEKTTDLSQVTDKLYHNYVISSTPCLSEIQTHNFSGDRHWLHLVVNLTTSWPWLPLGLVRNVSTQDWYLCCWESAIIVNKVLLPIE